MLVLYLSSSVHKTVHLTHDLHNSCTPIASEGNLSYTVAVSHQYSALSLCTQFLLLLHPI